MEICAGTRFDKHEEIVHGSDIKCPLCEKMNELADANTKIKDLERDVDILNNAE
jgi:hypothetical protein